MLTTNTQAKAMSAFLSGEMKDTVQINPAGAYGWFPPHIARMQTDLLLSSTRTVLLAQGTSEALPQLGGQRKHVDQGKMHYYRNLSYLDVIYA